MLFGRPGALKSFLALDWALCIAAGVRWHGHDVQPGSVVYVAGEGASGYGAAWRPGSGRVRWTGRSAMLSIAASVSSLRGAADMMARLQREHDTSPLLRLQCSKMKDAAEFDELLLRLEPSEGSLVLSLAVDPAEERGLTSLPLLPASKASRSARSAPASPATTRRSPQA